MKLRKNDIVLIISGKDKGKKGKILQVFLKESEKSKLSSSPSSFARENKVMVEGVNLRKKHRRPRKSGEKGQIVILPGSISVSNVKLICSKCGKATRVGYKFVDKKKYRVCKKCGQEI